MNVAPATENLIDNTRASSTVDPCLTATPLTHSPCYGSQLSYLFI